MLRVPSPAPAVGSGGQSMDADSHTWPSLTTPLWVAPAEFDGSVQLKLHKSIGCVEGTLGLKGLNANCC